MRLMWIMLTDGREYIKDSLPAWQEVLDMPVVIVDDSGDDERRSWLRTEAAELVMPGIERVGYTAAMAAVMNVVVESNATHFIFTEDDFMPVDLPDVRESARIVDRRNLAQMSWRRQAWYPREKRNGGILQAVARRGNCTEMTEDGVSWIEHSAYWTCNPAVSPRWVAERGWPQVRWSETSFSKGLMAEGFKSGCWGKWDDPPVTEHVGHIKVGINH